MVLTGFSAFRLCARNLTRTSATSAGTSYTGGCQHTKVADCIVLLEE